MHDVKSSGEAARRENGASSPDPFPPDRFAARAFAARARDSKVSLLARYGRSLNLAI